eukprot:TRINITY_DN2843_c0_g1_i25.p1 TRINITY_DN2843_c0_g1~~TRINITY_DN2843_c0_g1_i25.p1  ORF type:complete len:198 (-),score=41.06 TRINITY_DN2843_c0_g1_i25:744-1337(-)
MIQSLAHRNSSLSPRHTANPPTENRPIGKDSLKSKQFSSNPNRLMDSIGLQAQPPKFNGSTSHLGAAACICSSIFTGSIQKCTLKPRKMSLIAISSSPQQLTPKCSSERGDAATSSNGVGGTLSDACGGKFLQVVLVSPQIPGNVGCIARTCAAALVGLHLIEPLGFQVADAKLKRAGIGLHYWPYPSCLLLLSTVD